MRRKATNLSVNASWLFWKSGVKGSRPVYVAHRDALPSKAGGAIAPPRPSDAMRPRQDAAWASSAALTGRPLLRPPEASA